MRAITSLQNERVKLIRSLEMRKVRRETNLFVAEGASVLVTAREAGWTPRMLVFLAGSTQSGIARGLLAWAEAAGAECLDVSAAVLTKLAAKDNPQTMLGVFEQRWTSEPARRARVGEPMGRAGGHPRSRQPRHHHPHRRRGRRERRHLDRRQLRSLLARSRARQHGLDLQRAADAHEPGRFLSWTEGWTGDIVGTHLSATEDFRAVAYRARTLLAMGSEGPGLSPALAAACSRLVKIPMAGRLDSLNLAVATALMLYEMRKDRLHLS